MKKFTSLMLMLLCAVTTWAQVSEGTMYRLKDATQDLYLTITGYDGSGATGAHGTVPMLSKSTANNDQVWYFEATGTDGQYYLKSKSEYYIVHEAWNVTAYASPDTKGIIQFIDNGDNTYKIKNVNAEKYYKIEYVGSGSAYFPFCDVTSETASNVASWTIETVDETEFSLSEAYAALLNAIAEAETLQTAVNSAIGTTIGTYTQETADALSAAITTAKVLTNETAQDSDVTALQTVIDATQLILPEAGKYYVVECPLFERVQGVKKALYSNGSGNILQWDTEDLANKAYYWEIYPSGDGYIFKNASDGTYIPAVSGDRYTMTEEESSAYAFTLSWLTAGVFNITGSGTMHCGGHGSGSGSSGYICSWGGDATSASAWTITEVADPDLGIAIANLQNRVDELNEMITFTGTNPGEYPASATAQLTEPIAAAQTVLDGGSELSATYTEALTTLNSAIGNIDLTANPVVAGKYIIVSAASTFGENTKAISCYGYNTSYGVHCTPAWAPLNTNDPLQYWTLEANSDGSFNIKATYEGNYITSATSMSATAGTATFTLLGKAQFNINLGGVLHTNGWNWGGDAASLTTWEGGTDTASAWKLIAVAGEPSFTYDLAVSAAGYATLCLGFDATIPAGVECYTISENIDNYVTLAAVTDVLPAGEAVIVKANEGTYTFASATTDVTASETNLFKGTLLRKEYTDTSYTYYILSNGSNGVGLYPDAMNNSKFVNNANKAYLPIATASAAASYSFNFDWEGTTGINVVEAEGTSTTGAIYDITGRAVKAITAPGLYIIDGKKVVVK